MASKIAEKILDAALACFAESGLNGSTTKKISDLADCTEGSLFRIFGSKEKLFSAALHRAFDRGRMPTEELARILEADQNFERALRKAMLEFFDRLSEHYVRITTFALLERPEFVRDYLYNPSQSLARTIAHAIEREIYRGKLRGDIEPTTAALQLASGLWHFAFVSRIVAPELKLPTKASRRAAVENSVEIWFRGMQKTPPKNDRNRAKTRN